MIRRVLAAVESVPIDPEIALIAAEYWRHFRARGRTLGDADALTAATARRHGFTLETYNHADFPMDDIAIYEPMPAL